MRFWEAMKALQDGYAVIREDLIEPLLPADIKGSEYETDFEMNWKLYTSPPELLTFFEIMERIKDRDRFARKHWPITMYFEMHNGLIFCERRDLTPSDFLANDYFFTNTHRGTAFFDPDKFTGTPLPND